MLECIRSGDNVIDFIDLSYIFLEDIKLYLKKKKKHIYMDLIQKQFDIP